MASSLLKTAGFLPYLAALFINAFTDLGHKIIIQNTVFKIYDNQEQIVLTAILNALVLLPFVLLFSPSGYLSDKYPKARVMQLSALLAVFVTLGITFAYHHGLFWLAFGLTFILALQSAIYSPAKYGYIKELTGEKQISAANAAVQGTTTVAILGGIITYTLFFETHMPASYHDEADILRAVAPLGWLLVTGSLIEFFLALRLPKTKETDRDKRFALSRYARGAYLFKNLRLLRRKREVLRAVIWLAAFWSVSQVLLAVFGAYAKEELGINNTIIVQGVMALAGIGIILGSLSAAHFSRYYIHMGLVPLGAVGMACMLFALPLLPSITLIALCFLLFGYFAGLFIVPLNALIQQLTPGVHLGSILAGNNFIQNIAMIFFLGLTTVVALNGMNALPIFYMLLILTAAVGFYAFRAYLLMFCWGVVESVLSLRYKIVYEGLENIPGEGAVLLLGNHVSWLDWALLQFGLKRRIHYLMERAIYAKPWIKPVMELAEVIPVSRGGSKEAFAQARIHLRRGEVVGIFPEGHISRDGRLSPFKKGFESIVQNHRGVIVPFAVTGILGSRFSRVRKGTIERSLWRRVIRIRFAAPIPIDSDAQRVRSEVEGLLNR